jgi:hypothetical protein
MAGFNPMPSSIQIGRMLRRVPPVGGIGFKSGVTQKPFPLKRATGGGIPDSPMTPVVGAINTSTPGRADYHPTHVPPGSYVMPADIVSQIGEGNTAAGQSILAKMFLPAQAQNAGMTTKLMSQNAPYGAGGAPYGAQMKNMPGRGLPPPRHPKPLEAHGGVVPNTSSPGTPINISGGEFVIPPEEVKRRGRGDVDHGHEILDALINQLRAEHIKTLKNLPGPAQ